MKDLIEALTILLKYGDPYNPTHCEYDELTINSTINPESVSDEDKARLDELSFYVDEEGEYFKSFRFGSC